MVMALAKSLLFSHSQFPLFATLCVCAEVALSAFIVLKISYTEIDWIAYMDEVGGVLEGDFDYLHLRGPTGPLVYPAGFVWVYAPLHWITSAGANVRLAQWLFVGLIAFNLLVVLRVYNRVALAPPWVALWFLCSKRVHSLFVLRLFNDCVTATVFHCALLAFVEAARAPRASAAKRRAWIVACALFSFAVSIKMNILLMAPALFFALIGAGGASFAAIGIAGMAAIQILLGLPFLITNFWGYVGRALDLSRVFLFKWSVNFKWLDLFLARSECAVSSSSSSSSCESCAAWAAQELADRAGNVLANMEEVCLGASDELGARAIAIATEAAAGAGSAIASHRCCAVIGAFKDKRLAMALLAATALLNVAFAMRHRWCAQKCVFEVDFNFVKSSSLT